MIRIELVTPESDLVSAETYNKLFTMHGVIMVLLPGTIHSATLGNFFLPIMIGARICLPKINLLSWYLLIIGAPWPFLPFRRRRRYRWTFYTPYSTSYSNTWVIATALGIFVAGFLRFSPDSTSLSPCIACAARHDVFPHAAVRLGQLRHALIRCWARPCSR